METFTARQTLPIADRDIVERDIVEGVNAGASGVTWSAVLAGAAAAAALSYILVILGFGLGLSSVSPWAGSGIGVTAFGIATILWLSFTQVAASATGGYIAGRLRVKWVNVHTDEVYFRDTAHGFLSWAVASLVVAAFLASAISGFLKTGAEVAGSTLAGAGAGIGVIAAKSDDVKDSSGYFVDSLFRADPNATTTPPDASDASTRVEAARIFATDMAAGALTADDKRYLGQVVAKRTGLAQPEAEQRVDQAFTALKQNIDTAKTKAKEVADQTRKASAAAALWIFISLLAGAFFGSLAATIGGRHRDTYSPVVRAR